MNAGFGRSIYFLSRAKQRSGLLKQCIFFSIFLVFWPSFKIQVQPILIFYAHLKSHVCWGSFTLTSTSSIILSAKHHPRLLVQACQDLAVWSPIHISTLNTGRVSDGHQPPSLPSQDAIDHPLFFLRRQINLSCSQEPRSHLSVNRPVPKIQKYSSTPHFFFWVPVDWW